MDSGRLFRAVIMVVTLLICLWAINWIQARKESPVVAPIDTLHTGKTRPAASRASVTEPAVKVETLPLVALDNTCYYSASRDLSGCTGTWSGGAAREYHFATTDAEHALYITAKPKSDEFDLSLVLMSPDNHCVMGRDDAGPGMAERAVVKDLKPGEYLLVIGGYADNCGPYELTVSTEAPQVAQITDTKVHSGPNGKVVRWDTFAERAVQHYVVYRTDGDSRVRVAVLRAHGSPAGFASYRVMDRLAPIDSTYEIEAVAPDGRTEWVSVQT
jgi:hypothetical protein